MTIFLNCIFVAFSLFSPPEETNVVVLNHLENQSINTIDLLLPNRAELLPIQIPSPIPPGESTEIALPWGYINRVIVITNKGNVYYQMGFPASSDPDTIRVSLDKYEFGGIFDRVYGTMQIGVLNYSNLNIASVHVTGEGLPEGDILGNNPLMPGELLRLWVQSTEPHMLVFFDSDGFSSDTLVATANPDTIHKINNDMFFHVGGVHSTSYTGYDITVANCISTEEIVLVEAYDTEGYSILFFDLTERPLKTWDRLATQVDYPPDFIVCTDSRGREYSLDRPDSLYGAYVFDLLSLDFDFSFPEGQ